MTLAGAGVGALGCRVILGGPALLSEPLSVPAPLGACASGARCLRAAVSAGAAPHPFLHQRASPVFGNVGLGALQKPPILLPLSRRSRVLQPASGAAVPERQTATLALRGGRHAPTGTSPSAPSGTSCPRGSQAAAAGVCGLSCWLPCSHYLCPWAFPWYLPCELGMPPGREFPVWIPGLLFCCASISLKWGRRWP